MSDIEDYLPVSERGIGDIKLKGLKVAIDKNIVGMPVSIYTPYIGSGDEDDDDEQLDDKLGVYYPEDTEAANMQMTPGVLKSIDIIIPGDKADNSPRPQNLVVSLDGKSISKRIPKVPDRSKRPYKYIKVILVVEMDEFIISNGEERMVLDNPTIRVEYALKAICSDEEWWGLYDHTNNPEEIIRHMLSEYSYNYASIRTLIDSSTGRFSNSQVIVVSNSTFVDGYNDNEYTSYIYNMISEIANGDGLAEMLNPDNEKNRYPDIYVYSAIQTKYADDITQKLGGTTRECFSLLLDIDEEFMEDTNELKLYMTVDASDYSLSYLDCEHLEFDNGHLKHLFMDDAESIRNIWFYNVEGYHSVVGIHGIPEENNKYNDGYGYQMHSSRFDISFYNQINFKACVVMSEYLLAIDSLDTLAFYTNRFINQLEYPVSNSGGFVKKDFIFEGKKFDEFVWSYGAYPHDSVNCMSSLVFMLKEFIPMAHTYSIVINFSAEPYAIVLSKRKIPDDIRVHNGFRLFVESYELFDINPALSKNHIDQLTDRINSLYYLKHEVQAQYHDHLKWKSLNLKNAKYKLRMIMRNSPIGASVMLQDVNRPDFKMSVIHPL